MAALQAFNQSNRNFVILALLLSFVLAGCGGGSSDEEPTGIFVNAGSDRSVNEQTTVQLSGQVQSPNDTLTYSWSVEPLIAITHADTSSSAASFIAPAVAEVTNYTFTLRVNDGAGNAASDSVVYAVQPINELPIADIQLAQWPTLEFGIYPAGVDLQLDASASIDPDNAASDAIIAYQWQQLAGANILDAVITDTAVLNIQTPILEQSQVFSFSVTVTDNEQAQGSTDISFTVQSAEQTLPVVNAGIDHQVFSGESIILDGSASSSVPAAEPLTTNWRNDSGIAVSIDDSNSLQSFAIAPEVGQRTELLMTLSVVDQFGNEVEDSIRVVVQEQPLTALNDTGVLQQATLDELGTAHLNAFPGQDGQRGQDRIAENGLLEKAGRGQAGFDFTRLNQNGDEVDNINLPWRCVRDNITGYVWEIKTDEASLHDTNNSYSWYQTNNNGGFAGELNGVDTQCTLAQCNTAAFVEAVNNEGLCGFFDWRLPFHDELLSIVHLGQEQAPMVDTDYFPNSGDSDDAPLWYWTRQPNADGVQGDAAQAAWAIDFASGTDNFLNKRSAARIRLVRAGRP